jgi:catecholate siderophore receptor
MRMRIILVYIILLFNYNETLLIFLLHLGAFMSYITSRKHQSNDHFTNSSKLSSSQRNMNIGAAVAALILPMVVQANEPQKNTEVTTTQTQSLPDVQVNAKVENEFKVNKAASNKYSQQLIDTPQTIAVIKRELIEQQGAVNLTEALRNTPGVGTFFLGENGSTNTGDAVYMRGFDTSSSIYVDGVRDLGSISRDLFNIEQIDVLKGSAGTDSGRSAPTGSINLSSKQAYLDDATFANITLGSAKQKRATLDKNIVLSTENGSALRLNLITQDSGVAGRDLINNKRWAFAPSFAFGINTSTRFNLSYLHVKQDNVPDGGVPTMGLPGFSSSDPTRPFLSNAPKVNPNNFYGSASDFDKVTADMLTGKIEHDFSPTTKLVNTTRVGKTSQNYLLTAFMGNTVNWLTPSVNDYSTWTLARNIRTLKDQENNILTNQTNLLSAFTLGDVQHNIISGIELINEKQNTWGYSGTGTLPAANLYKPNPNDAITGYNLVRNGTFTRGLTNTISAYAFDTLKLNEQWLFNLGLRVDRYDTDYSSASLSTLRSHPTLPVGTMVSNALNMSGNLLNLKLGGLYKPTKDSSIYASYSTSKQPPGGSNFALSTSASSPSNPQFEPQETKNIEIGTKWDLLQQKVTLSAAIYRTEVSNEVEQNIIDLLYYQTGKKRVSGIELGITGAINRDWLVSAGYAHMNTEVESGRVATANGVNNLAYAPKETFTAWTSYQLPMGIKLGGGARFIDALLRGRDGAVGTPSSTESYWVADMMASYAVNRHLDVQVNINNLTNKTYVAAINKSGYRYTPGAPRTISLGLNMKF